MTKDFKLEKVEKMLNAGRIEIPVENLVNYINFLTDYTEEVNLVKATVVGGTGKNKHKHYLVIQGKNEDVLEYDEETETCYNKWGVADTLDTLSMVRAKDAYEDATTADLKYFSPNEGVLLVITEKALNETKDTVVVKDLKGLADLYYKKRLFYLDESDLEDIIDFEHLYTRPTTNYPTFEGLTKMGLSQERTKQLLQYEDTIGLSFGFTHYVEGKDFDLLGIENKNHDNSIIVKVEGINWLKNKVLFNNGTILDIDTTYKLLKGHFQTEGVN